VKFGIVADDNTGATDAAGMLTEKGVRTILFVELPEPGHLGRIAEEYDAGVIGACTRSIAPQAAYERTYQAVKLLAQMGVEKIQVKHCSTFDSTPEGNIGPSLDAALDALKTQASIVAPALPINGRTTYFGYHFVHGELLSESPLKDHPLNPMTDANLVRWLQRQTRRKVSLAPLPVVRQGAGALRDFLRQRTEQGEEYFVTDAIDQKDLAIAAEATVRWPLISGGSGITAEIPALLFPDRKSLSFSERLSGCGRRTLAIAGSCSPVTREQNAFALANGFVGLRLDGGHVLEGKVDLPGFAQAASNAFARGKSVLLYASSDPVEVKRVQEHGRSLGLSAAETGEKIAAVLSEIGGLIMDRENVGRLVISGGETSGAVCRQLGTVSFEVGLPIEPGVPYCFPIQPRNLMMALKSGNFGSADFCLRVQQL
jgi:3-dehydrotetronate 4-kinase